MSNNSMRLDVLFMRNCRNGPFIFLYVGIGGRVHVCFRIYFSNFSKSNTSDLFIYLGGILVSACLVSFGVEEIYKRSTAQ